MKNVMLLESQPSSIYVKLWLSDISRVESWELSDVSANAADAIFRVNVRRWYLKCLPKCRTTLNIQRSFNPKAEVLRTLNSSIENPRTNISWNVSAIIKWRPNTKNKDLDTKCYVEFLELGQLSQYSVWLQTGRPGFDPRKRQSIFPLASVSRPALRPTQPPVQSVPGVLSGVKVRPRRDADHSPPSSAKVNE
jgi:hypothetical protein